MFEDWKAELPENIIRGFNKAKGTALQLKVIYEWDKRGLETGRQVDAYLAAGGTETNAAQTVSEMLKKPGPQFVLDFLKAEAPEIRWFRIEDKALKVAEEGLSLALDSLRPVQDSALNVLDPIGKAMVIEKAINSFTKLADKLPHLIPAARQIAAKLENARTKFEPRQMTVEEIDEALLALNRERARLTKSTGSPEATGSH